MKPGTIHLPLTSRTTVPFGRGAAPRGPMAAILPSTTRMSEFEIMPRSLIVTAVAPRSSSAPFVSAREILTFASHRSGLPGSAAVSELSAGNSFTSARGRENQLEPTAQPIERPSAPHCRKSAPTSVSLRWGTPGEARSIVLPSSAGLASRNSCCEICARSHLPSGLSRRSSTGARFGWK